MTEPFIADTQPKAVDLKAGQTVWWCSCGRSKSQPFCDGSHLAWKGLFRGLGRSGASSFRNDLKNWILAQSGRWVWVSNPRNTNTYVCGSKPKPAYILGQNPIFEIISKACPSKNANVVMICVELAWYKN